MFRAWLFAVALSAGPVAQAADTALGAAPSYSISGIVNAASFSTGPFAPNSIVSIFGTDLARSAQGITSSDIRNGRLPVELNYTRVVVNGTVAPLFYVSEGQVNFLLPPDMLPGNAKVRVVREGLAGPEIALALSEAAPAVFQQTSGLAIAQHSADYTLIDRNSPARSGEWIVLYATGLGRTTIDVIASEIPQFPAPLVKTTDLKVLLNGTAIDPVLIKYAGVTPGSAGLYQVNLVLPDTPPDPEVRLTIGTLSSPTGVKLAVK